MKQLWRAIHEEAPELVPASQGKPGALTKFKAKVAAAYVLMLIGVLLLAFGWVAWVVIAGSVCSAILAWIDPTRRQALRAKGRPRG
jgi:hypothetical protein